MKYNRFTPSGCKDIRIRKFEFVAKTQFISSEGGGAIFAIFASPPPIQLNPEYSLL